MPTVGPLPAARTPDPMDAPPLRWGVMGTGWIAERFVAALQSSTRQRVVAVASRDLERARAFGAGRPLGSYEALVDDPGVDAVYVATPHPAHRDCALLAIEAGKPVVVEKPLALDASAAQEIVAAARARGVFCMEALWTFFLPKFDVIRQLVDAGELGEPRSVVADNGETFDASHRIWRAELAGGPVLDLGTYPVALACWVLGAPTNVLAIGQMAPTGVLGQASIVMTHEGDNQSALHTTIQAETPTSAFIAGSENTLAIDGPFYMPGGFTLSDGRRYTEPGVRHAALHFEAAEAARNITEGRLESELRGLDDSLVTLGALDAIQDRPERPTIGVA